MPRQMKRGNVLQLEKYGILFESVFFSDSLKCVDGTGNGSGPNGKAAPRRGTASRSGRT